MKVLQLGKIVKDTVTDMTGMLTHLILHLGGNKDYVFQPRGLNPQTGEPVDKMWISEERVEGGNFIDIDPPLNILNTFAQDEASGFKGTVVNIVYHINGCIHVGIKPKGLIKSTGSSVTTHDFDIRRVSGPMIKQMSEEQIEESVKKTPSPEGYRNARR